MYACYVWKQLEIWLQNRKMDTEKNNAMHVNPKHKWCMEKKIQKLKNQKKFSFDRLSIDQIPIESGRFKPKILTHFQLVEKHPRSIENLEKWNFWKTEEVLCRKHSNQLISWMKCMSMSLKVFQKYMNSTQIFQRQDFQPFCPKIQSMNIFCIKIIEHIILDDQNKFTHIIMY